MNNIVKFGNNANLPMDPSSLAGLGTAVQLPLLVLVAVRHCCAYCVTVSGSSVLRTWSPKKMHAGQSTPIHSSTA